MGRGQCGRVGAGRRASPHAQAPSVRSPSPLRFAHPRTRGSAATGPITVSSASSYTGMARSNAWHHGAAALGSSAEVCGQNGSERQPQRAVPGDGGCAGATCICTTAAPRDCRRRCASTAERLRSRASGPINCRRSSTPSSSSGSRRCRPCRRPPACRSVDRCRSPRSRQPHVRAHGPVAPAVAAHRESTSDASEAVERTAAAVEGFRATHLRRRIERRQRVTPCDRPKHTHLPGLFVHVERNVGCAAMLHVGQPPRRQPNMPTRSHLQGVLARPGCVRRSGKRTQDRPGLQRRARHQHPLPGALDDGHARIQRAAVAQFLAPQ